VHRNARPDRELISTGSAGEELPAGGNQAAQIKSSHVV